MRNSTLLAISRNLKMCKIPPLRRISHTGSSSATPIFLIYLFPMSKLAKAHPSNVPQIWTDSRAVKGTAYRTILKMQFRQPRNQYLEEIVLIPQTKIRCWKYRTHFMIHNSPNNRANTSLPTIQANMWEIRVLSFAYVHFEWKA